MPKIQESKNSFRITLPKDIVTFKGWEKGDHLEYFEERPGVPAVRKVDKRPEKSSYAIQVSKGRYHVAVPTPLMTLYGWKKGDTLEFFEERPGVLAIRKVR